MTQRNTADTIDWYRTHETTGQIGFNPDGRCLQVCRTARNIGPVWPSAVAAQAATPVEHRIKDVAKIKRGMVVYYDDPNDDNPYGHIVTVVGRIKDADPGSLGSLLVRTNSVRAGEVVVTRGDYFGRYWSDPFVFASDYLNGQVLDLPEAKQPPQPPRLPPVGERRLIRVRDLLEEMADHHEEAGNGRIARALRRDRREVIETLRRFRQD